jgi:hypothetical protein
MGHVVPGKAIEMADFRRAQANCQKKAVRHELRFDQNKS